MKNLRYSTEIRFVENPRVDSIYSNEPIKWQKDQDHLILKNKKGDNVYICGVKLLALNYQNTIPENHFEIVFSGFFNRKNDYLKCEITTKVYKDE